MKKVIFIIGFLLLFFNCYSQSGWISQFVDNYANLKIIQFINPQTGWTCSSNKIYKTVNSGVNWLPIHSSTYTICGFYYIGENICFKAGYKPYNPHQVEGFLDKSTNGGSTWINVLDNINIIYEKFYFSSNLFGWNLCYPTSRTTNGGNNWDYVSTNNQYGIRDIKMISNSISFGCGLYYIYKTNNYGNNWETILYDLGKAFNSIFFLDSLNGFVSGSYGTGSSLVGFILKTTNSGVNWIENYFILNETIYKILFTTSKVGYFITQNKIFKTTNTGVNWTIQLCDTSHTFNDLFFLDSLNGWIACSGNIILHTTNGGNVSARNIGSNIPDKFSLSQNYPNPFNPTTNIKYQISKNSFVTLKVFDILGKEIATLVNEKLQPGEYEVQFPNVQSANVQLTSGIYFYRLTAEDFSETKRMVLLK